MKKTKGHDISGILLLNKPLGISSNASLQKAKRLFNARKAGHTGSLDPLATGLLPICFGEATKFSQYLLDANKAYEVTIELGVTTTTGDSEGHIVQEKPVDGFSLAELESVVHDFLGETTQVPPMYSALKHKGQPLYKYARQGTQIPREPRAITLHQLHITAVQAKRFNLSVVCSKGTYIRVLAEDIGKALGVGAHISALHRTQVGHFLADSMLSFEQLSAMQEQALPLSKCLLGVDAALEGIASITLTKEQALQIRQGQMLTMDNAKACGLRALYDAASQFMGVGELSEEGELRAKRLCQYAP